MIAVVGIGHRGTTTGAEQLDGEFLVGEAITTDEHLLDLRQALQRQPAQHAGVDRHLAPAHQLQTSREDFAVHVLARGFGLGRILIEEHHAHGILPGQFDAELLLGDRAQELIRLLDQQATAITGLAIGVDTAAVSHAGEGLNSGLEQVMASLTLHMGDQAEAAVILELIRTVQTCFHRGDSHQAA